MFLICSKYLNGEVKKIIGVTENEDIAKRKVRKLKDTIAVGEGSYYYTYIDVDIIE